MERALDFFKIIFRKDLRLFVIRPQFYLYVGILALCLLFSTATGIHNFLVKKASNEKWQSKQLESLSYIKETASLRGPGYVQTFAPNRLSVFNLGIDDLITAPFVTTQWTKQVIGYINARGPISTFIMALDTTTLALVLMPVFIIFLCNDFVIGEVNNGTLVTNLIFNVPLRTFLTAKFLAVFVGIFGSVAALFCMCIGAVHLALGMTGAEALRCIFVLGVFGLYIAIWICLIFLFQSLSTQTMRGVAVSILSWIVFVFVLPLVIQWQQRVWYPLDRNADYFEKKAEALTKLSNTDWVSTLPWSQRTIGSEPFIKAFTFSIAVEQELLKSKLDSLSAKDIAAYGDSFFGAAFLSPYYMATYVVSELTNTGVGDYVNMRNQMIHYRQYYHDFFVNSQAIANWSSRRQKGVATPVEELKKLDMEFNRLDLWKTLARIKLPLIGMIVFASFLMAVLRPLLPYLLFERLAKR